MFQDVRFATRLFLRQRGFFLTAVLTIALGVGLGATVFAVVDGVLFRPLPYHEPDRLIAVYAAVRADKQTQMPLSWPDLVDWRAAAPSLSQLEGYTLGVPQARVKGGDETTQVACAQVTSGFLALLGIKAAIGRTLAPEEFTPGAMPAAVISYRLWKTAFGGELDVLGRTIEQSGRTLTVVGVLPRSFLFPFSSRRISPDVLVPFDSAGRTDRSGRVIYAIGRLAQGATLRQAQTELDAVALQLKPLFVQRPNSFPGATDGATVIDLRAHLTRSTHQALWLVFCAVGAVFAIASVNLVGLLLAHGEDRRRELAIRAAIGAGRAALLRQLLTEAAVLAVAGAGAGWLLSVVWFDAVLAQLPRWMQFLGEPALDARAAVFAGLLGALALVVAGVIPAFRASREDPRAGLAAGSRGMTTSNRGRHVLIMFEVALAAILLFAGSIMLRSWIRLYSQDTGMDAEHVIAVRAVPASGDAARRNAFNTALAENIRRVPGVQSVALVDLPLLQRAMKGSSFVPPRRVSNAAGMDTDLTVTPGYFQTMGIALRAGRDLLPQDRGRAVVISEAVANAYWPAASPVGQWIRYGSGMREIVGVVASARDMSLDGPPMPTLYHVWDDARPPVATVVVRFAGPALSVIPEIRRAVRSTDDSAAITMLATVEELLSTSVAERNFNTLLFTVFAAAGLAVAVVGIYGLVSFVVARRRREMGIRLALGASRGGLKIFAMSGTLRWVAAGLVAGSIAALALAKSLKPFVYQVPENDPWTLAAVALAFFGVAAAASYVPARRAARVDPMTALRAE